MKKTVVVLCLCFFTSHLLVGCAAIFKGTSNNVDFSSDPAGAKVYLTEI